MEIKLTFSQYMNMCSEMEKKKHLMAYMDYRNKCNQLMVKFVSFRQWLGFNI